MGVKHIGNLDPSDCDRISVSIEDWEIRLDVDGEGSSEGYACIYITAKQGDELVRLITLAQEELA